MNKKGFGLLTCALVLLPLAAACGTTYFDLPAAPTATQPDPSVFASQIVRGGFASREFTIAAAGTVQVTLTSVTPAVVLGLGIGIPRPDNRGCYLSASVDTAAGSSPQLTAAADAGSYCVKVFDIGTITETATFSVTIK
jgi:hypothetical protein